MYEFYCFSLDDLNTIISMYTISDEEANMLKHGFGHSSSLEIFSGVDVFVNFELLHRHLNDEFDSPCKLILQNRSIFRTL